MKNNDAVITGGKSGLTQPELIRVMNRLRIQNKKRERLHKRPG